MSSAPPILLALAGLVPLLGFAWFGGISMREREARAATLAFLLAAAGATAFVKHLAAYCGAVDVGVTEVRPCHVYTRVGRGSGRWGEPINLGHRWAVAFSVEVGHGVMRHAPEAPVVAESAH